MTKHSISQKPISVLKIRACSFTPVSHRDYRYEHHNTPTATPNSPQSFQTDRPITSFVEQVLFWQNRSVGRSLGYVLGQH